MLDKSIMLHVRSNKKRHTKAIFILAINDAHAK